MTASMRLTSISDRLAAAPHMVVADGDTWMDYVETAPQAELQFTMAWARLMSLELRFGKSLEEVAVRTARDAATYVEALEERFDMTLPAKAVDVLRQCWKDHGPSLAAWFGANPHLVEVLPA